MGLFSALKTNIISNLDDSGSVNYSSTELDNSLQDGYDDIVARTQCLLKKVTLNWVADEVYLYPGLTPYSITDFMATVAIFDNVTNRWLMDNLSRRDFLKFRPDWELVTGSPQYWAPRAPGSICVFPHYTTAAGSFVLYYWATAPAMVTSEFPIIPIDLQYLIEAYVTADMLETFEEYKKASFYWSKYFHPDNGIEAVATRFKNIAKSDLLLLA